MTNHTAKREIKYTAVNKSSFVSSQSEYLNVDLKSV